MSLVQFRKLIQQFCKERSIGNIVEKHLRNTVENTIGNTVDELGDVSEMNLRVVSGQDGELSKLSNLRVFHPWVINILLFNLMILGYF